MNRVSKDERISGRIAAGVGVCFGIALLIVTVMAMDQTGQTGGRPSPEAMPERNIIPVPPAASSASALRPPRQVYECNTPSGRVLSDTSCGPNSVAREVDTSRLSTYSPVPAPEVIVQPAGPAVTVIESPPAAVPSGPSLQECLEIQASVDRIDERMRRGYSSEEGEYYRARRRKLTTLYYDLKCSITGRR